MHCEPQLPVLWTAWKSVENRWEIAALRLGVVPEGHKRHRLDNPDALAQTPPEQARLTRRQQKGHRLRTRRSSTRDESPHVLFRLGHAVIGLPKCRSSQIAGHTAVTGHDKGREHVERIAKLAAACEAVNPRTERHTRVN